MRSLVVINPNSSQTVTSGIEAAVFPLGQPEVPMRFLTLAEGPPGIENQMQADRVVAPMLDLAAKQQDAAGFVVACFGDPGVYALRDLMSVPVIGIQEAAVLSALMLGQRFGVISILPASVPRHLRAFGAMGVMTRLAADRAIGLSVSALSDQTKTLQAMIDTGKQLRDHDGADVLIMGCAGMAGYRSALEDATGLPVVEPCQAGVVAALGQISLGYGRNQ